MKRLLPGALLGALIALASPAGATDLPLNPQPVVPVGGTLPIVDPPAAGAAGAAALITQLNVATSLTSAPSPLMTVPLYLDSGSGNDYLVVHAAGSGTGTPSLPSASGFSTGTLVGSYQINFTSSSAFNTLDVFGNTLATGCAINVACTPTLTANLTGSIAWTGGQEVLTVTAASSGGAWPGMKITGAGFSATNPVYIRQQLSGSAGCTSAPCIFSLTGMFPTTVIGSETITGSFDNFNPTMPTATYSSADKYIVNLGVNSTFAKTSGTIPSSGTGSLTDLPNHLLWGKDAILGAYAITTNAGGTTYTMTDPNGATVGSANTATGSSVSNAQVTFTLPSASYTSAVLSLTLAPCPSSAPCLSVKTTAQSIMQTNLARGVTDAGDGTIVLRCSSSGTYPRGRDASEATYGAVKNQNYAGGPAPLIGGTAPSTGHIGYLTIQGDRASTCGNGSGGLTLKPYITPSLYAGIVLSANYIILENLKIQITSTNIASLGISNDNGGSVPPLTITPEHHLIVRDSEIHGAGESCFSIEGADYVALVNNHVDGCSPTSGFGGSGITVGYPISVSTLGLSEDPNWPFPAHIWISGNTIAGAGEFGIDCTVSGNVCTDGNGIILDSPYRLGFRSNGVAGPVIVKSAGFVGNYVIGVGARGVEGFGTSNAVMHSNKVAFFGQDENLSGPRVAIDWSTPQGINTSLANLSYNNAVLGNQNVVNYFNVSGTPWAPYHDDFPKASQDFLACSQYFNLAAAPFTTIYHTFGSAFAPTFATAISYAGGAPPGAYKVAFSSGSAFAVTDPNGSSLGSGTVGSPFTSGEINFTIPSGPTFTSSDIFLLDASTIPPLTTSTLTPGESAQTPATNFSIGSTASHVPSGITYADLQWPIESGNFTFLDGRTVPYQYAFLIRDPGNLKVQTTASSPVVTFWTNARAELDAMLAIGPTVINGTRWMAQFVGSRAYSVTGVTATFIPAGSYPLFAVSGTPTAVVDNGSGANPRYSLQATLYQGNGSTQQNATTTSGSGTYAALPDAFSVPQHIRADVIAAMTAPSTAGVYGCRYPGIVERDNQQVRWFLGNLDPQSESPETPVLAGTAY
jgi:hypothetical protein